MHALKFHSRTSDRRHSVSARQVAATLATAALLTPLAMSAGGCGSGSDNDGDKSPPKTKAPPTKNLDRGGVNKTVPFGTPDDGFSGSCVIIRYANPDRDNFKLTCAASKASKTGSGKVPAGLDPDEGTTVAVSKAELTYTSEDNGKTVKVYLTAPDGAKYVELAKSHPKVIAPK